MITKQEAAAEALEFLQQHNTGIVATAGPDDQPFASPVYYVVQPDFTIYFATSPHTHKFQNIILNNKVSFCVGTGPTYTVVNVHGTAHVVDKEEHEKALALIHGSVNSPMAAWPVTAITALGTAGVAVCKITPKQISYLNLTSPDQLEGMAKYVYEILP